ncbi:MAG: fused MFS/spermidine synthase, partial [Thermodesulfovibrionales bacterium]|nr:fused MFS/spermidine synthase [Thermodesulfovibrionales bacterium]
RFYLINSSKTYDYIVLDVFNGDTTPGHILSVEALQILKTRMTQKGILAVNLAGSLKKETFITASVIKTLESVFKTVEIYPLFSLANSEGWGNLAVIAYDYPSIPLDLSRVKDFPVHPFAKDLVSRLADQRFSFPSDTPAIILSDDYNPIDFYDIWLKEKVRKNILENSSLDIFI